jgi:hypothetical protein
MLLYGLLCGLLGGALAVFNRRLARPVFGSGFDAGSFINSVERQNTALIGAVFFGCGALTIYLAFSHF